MIFNDNRMIIFLYSKGLYLVRGDKNYQLKFSENIVIHQDIISLNKLKQLLADFLSQEKIEPQSAILLLASELLYEKDILAKNPEEAQQKFDLFLNKVPFTQISKIKIFDEDKIHTIATNANLWTPIKDCLQQLNWKIDIVLPAPAVGIFGSTFKDKDDLQKVLPKIDNAKRFNFLNIAPDVTQPVIKSGKDETTTSSAKKWLLGIVVIVLLAAIGILLYIFRSQMVSINSELKTKTLLPTPTEIPESISTTSAKLSKVDLTIEILNGSGKGGQAAKFKDILGKIGFQNITTGNYPGVYKGGTVLNYSPKVPDSLQQEIIKELNKSIASVSAQSTSSGKFDVSIIIGK